MVAGPALTSPRYSQQATIEEPRQGQVAALGPRGFSRVAYVDWGPIDARHAVICVHGLTRNGRDFDLLAQALAREGCRVVAPDLPGRGRSEWLKRPIDYDNATYLAAISTIFARLGVEEVDWVGTSLGGFIGMAMATQQGSPVRRLVLNDFGARVPAAALRRIGASSGQYPQFETIEQLEAYLRSLLAPVGDLTDAQWRHLAKHSLLEAADGKLRLNHDPALTGPFSWPFMVDLSLWHQWDSISCPVLILRGGLSDFLTSATMRGMQQRGQAAKRGLVQAVEVPDCGHAPALMSKEQIEVVVGFLLNQKGAISLAP